MKRKLGIHIIVRRSTIIAAIVHNKEINEINIMILPMVLIIMCDKPGQLEHLVEFSIAKQMDDNQCYGKGLLHLKRGLYKNNAASLPAFIKIKDLYCRK